MKKLLMLCATVLFFVSCEKESDSHDNYKMEFETTKVVLDNKGTGSVSCTVTPTDLDISAIKDLSYSAYSFKSSDVKLIAVSVIIVSATKDSKTPGKWNIALALSSNGKTLYTPDPKYYYHLAVTAVASIKAPTGDSKVSSNGFDIVFDRNVGQ